MTGEDEEGPAQADSNSRDSSGLQRRQLLATAGATLVGGLAGCGGNGGGDTDTPESNDTQESDDTPESSETPTATQTETETETETPADSTTGAIDSVEFLPDSQSFEVTFASPDDVAEVRVERPDGETERETAVDGGSVTISAKLYDSESIPGGTYTIRTLFNGEVTGSVTATVRKELSITDVTTTAGDEYPTFVVTVENVGDLAVVPEEVRLSGSIRDTTSVFGRTFSQESVPVGETTDIRIPFSSDVEGAPGGEGYAFDGELGCAGSGSVTVTVRQDQATDERVYDEVTATVSVGGDAVDESYDKYACSQVSVESVSRSGEEE